MNKIIRGLVLASAIPGAHAAIVQQQYTAVVDHYAYSGDELFIGHQKVQPGDVLTGFFSYDDSLVATPALFTGALNYNGSPGVTFATATLNGVDILGVPATPACGPFDLIGCSSTVMVRDRGGPVGSAERLLLNHVPSRPTGGLSTWPTPGAAVSVASISLAFNYRDPLAGNALPGQIDQAALASGFVSLTLSNGAGVFATVQSIQPPSAVPEPSTSWLFGAGVAGLLALAVRRRPRTNLGAARA